LKHRSNYHRLQQAEATCAASVRLALTDASRDSVGFAEFVRTQSLEAAERLIDTGDALEKLRATLLQLADRIEGDI
jgi:hypothetical protein